MVNMSSRSLPLLRTLIAMSRGDHLFPRGLYVMGFTDLIVEPDLRLPGGNTQPDLVIASSKVSHVVVWEAKESHNISLAQARLYDLIDAGVCEVQLNIAGARSGNYQISTAYLTSEGYGESLRDDLQAHGLAHAVESEYRSASPIEWRMVTGTLGPLTSIFSPLIVDADDADPSLYPFDRSSTSAEIAPYLINPLIEFAVNSRLQFAARDLTAAALGPLWQNLWLAESARAQMAANVDAALVDATRGGRPARALYGYLSRKTRRPSGRSIWEFNQARLSERTNHAGLRAALTRYSQYLRGELALFEEMPENDDDE